MHHGKGFIDVKFAGSTARITAIVVKHPIRKVGVLLNFAEDEPGTDCVSRASRDKNGLAFAQRNVFETILRGTIRYCLLNFLASHFWLQSCKYFSARPSSECVPHFRLADASGRAFVLRRIFVIRVDLDRELFLGKNEFRENREDAAAARQRASPFDGHLGPSFA